MDSAGADLIGIEEVSAELGSADRADGVFGEPGVGAFEMEAVVAAGDHPGGLVGPDFV